MVLLLVGGCKNNCVTVHYLQSTKRGNNEHKEESQAMAEELAKDLKTPDGLSQFSAFVTKLTVEAALKGEMSHHLGYGKSDPAGHWALQR